MGVLTFVLQYTCGKLIEVIDEGLLVKNKGVATGRNDMSSRSGENIVWIRTLSQISPHGHLGAEHGLQEIPR